MIEDTMKRVESNDPASIFMLANCYRHGERRLQEDEEHAIELFTKSVDLGYSKAHCHLAHVYESGGNLKKAKFHLEAAAMAGHEVARHNLGVMEAQSGNMERAIKHCAIAASAGYHHAMHELTTLFKQGCVSRGSIDSALAAYNDSCVEMRSEARDAAIRSYL